MGKIKILPDNVIDKISAGEVVARPASVVKELIDNAIDASAKSIEIHAEGGGKKRITVIDDGCGMDPEDAGRAVFRHATSKISAESDLQRIRTMGFRGEALSAIAAVSNVVIETKPSDFSALEGTRVCVEGGVIREVRVFGCPPGTSVTVGDLFFNVPARRKFLRSDAVEFGHIMDVVSVMALSHPHIRFELSHEGTSKLLCSRASVYQERIADVLGDEIGSSLTALNETGEGIDLKGFLVKPGITRAASKDIHLFVNRRPVRDRVLQHAVIAGFAGYLTKGEYPVAVLYLDIEPHLVDVNVHPAKSEVRFANSRMVHDFVESSIRKVLAGGSSSCERPVSRSFFPFEGGGSALSGVEGEKGEASALPLIPCDEKGEEEPLRIIGQFDQAYIVCEEAGGNLVLIDQHAAHERLGYEFLMKQMDKGGVESQHLLLPERIELSSREISLIKENLTLLSQTGFDVQPFSGTTLVVKAVPSLLAGASMKPLFEKISAELDLFGSSAAVSEAVDRILSVIACHRQVRAGDNLSSEEMNALVRDMGRYGISHCPHGRPAVVKIKKEEVKRWFKRG
jgi:DNA mismatch repair protein MutL